MYWYFWVIVVAVEAVAGREAACSSGYRTCPRGCISLVLLVTLTLTNLVSVGAYGEFEFWFASIKVAAIIVFLFLGTLFVLGLWPACDARHAPTARLAAHGGFMPNGIVPVLTGAVAATGFYFGAEIVTIAAAEAHEPAKAVAKATNSVITRVLVFYVGSILLVVALVPWNSPGMATPYVSALDAMGIPAAASIDERDRADGGAVGAEFGALRLVADDVRADAPRRCARRACARSTAAACRCARS